MNANALRETLQRLRFFAVDFGDITHLGLIIIRIVFDSTTPGAASVSAGSLSALPPGARLEFKRHPLSGAEYAHKTHYHQRRHARNRLCCTPHGACGACSSM
jgi:hypothetical protein